MGGRGMSTVDLARLAAERLVATIKQRSLVTRPGRRQWLQVTIQFRAGYEEQAIDALCSSVRAARLRFFMEMAPSIPGGVDSRATGNGVSVRAVRQYQIGTDEVQCRLDVLGAP